MTIVYSDLIDCMGNIYETVGENIRQGKNNIPKNGYVATVQLTLNNATWDAEILTSNYPSSSLTVNADSSELYLTDATANGIDIVSSEISKIVTCSGGHFNLYKQGIHQLSGCLMCAFDCNATDVDIEIELVFTVKEG